MRIHDDYYLHAAASYGHVECVKFLINEGCDPRKLIGTGSYTKHEHIKYWIKEYIDKTYIGYKRGDYINVIKYCDEELTAEITHYRQPHYLWRLRGKAYYQL